MSFRALLAGMAALVFLACGPVSGQGKGDRFDQELFSPLVRSDGTAAPYVGIWMSPEALEYSLSTDRGTPPGDAHVALRFFSRMLLFLVGPAEGKLDPGVVLTDKAVLRDRTGRTFTPVSVPPEMAAGFEIEGEKTLLAFPAFAPDGSSIAGTGKLELVLTGVGTERERVMTWAPPLKLAPAVSTRLAQLRAKHAAAVKATRVSTDGLVEGAVSWLAEFVLVDGRWLMLSWMPRELLIPNMTSGVAGDRETKAAMAKSLARFTCVILGTMGEKLPPEEMKRISERIRLVDAAGTQHAAVVPDDFILKTLAESLAGQKETTASVQLLVFPTATSFQANPRVSLAVLDAEGRAVQTVPWRKPASLPAGIATLLAPPGTRPPGKPVPNRKPAPVRRKRA